MTTLFALTYITALLILVPSSKADMKDELEEKFAKVILAIVITGLFASGVSVLGKYSPWAIRLVLSLTVLAAAQVSAAILVNKLESHYGYRDPLRRIVSLLRFVLLISLSAICFAVTSLGFKGFIGLVTNNVSYTEILLNVNKRIFIFSAIATATLFLISWLLPIIIWSLSAIPEKIKDINSNTRRSNFERLKTKRDVKGLIKALNDEKDVTIRRSAAEVLGQIKDPQAVDALIASLQDKELSVALAAIEALREIGDSHAVEPLIAALNDTRFDVRSLAASVLGTIGDSRAVNPLINMLNRSDSWTCASAVGALRKLGDKYIWDLLLERFVNILTDKTMNHGTAIRAIGALKYACGISPLLNYKIGKNDDTAAKWVASALEDILEYDLANITTEDLRKIAALKDLHWEYVYTSSHMGGDYIRDSYETTERMSGVVSFDRIRQLAQSELNRR